MFSHVTIGTNDIKRAVAFYDAVFAALGVGRFYLDGSDAGYGEAHGDQVWVMEPFDGNPAAAGNGTHIAFLAKARRDVDAFHTAALANGGTDEGAPGLRPHYHSNYYGAYVRDPDGNKIQAVCHSPPDAESG